MKKILFVIDSLGVGGAEKSLITLLNSIDYEQYSVDLQLFSKGGAFEKYLPKHVSVLKLPKYIHYTQNRILNSLNIKYFRYFVARFKYSLLLRLFPSSKHTTKAMLFWKSTSSCFDKTKKYDIAIAYGQGVPTFYVADKVLANKKFAWINALLYFEHNVLKYNCSKYLKFDKIVTVSTSSFENFTSLYNQFTQKTTIIKDLIDQNFIKQMSLNDSSPSIKHSCFKILTVARLDNGHKGYDIALDVAKILKERGVDFVWYAVGEGGFRSEMETFIKENNLTDKFVLLGAKDNPYPYFRACDLYVQTSRHEGFGLSIAEARILNKPVVTTEFEAVWNQMVQGKNGVVVPIDATAVADAIQDLIENPEKMNAISDYQRTEKKGNIEELQKFYLLIES